MKKLLFNSIILFFITQLIPIFGLKFSRPENLLVENAKENVFYLFQFPRSSNTLCLSFESLKVEVFLKLNGINFYRISNKLFLDSPTGQIPFAQYNGEYIDGSKNIISRAKEIIFEKQNENLENEQNLNSKKLKFKKFSKKGKKLASKFKDIFRHKKPLEERIIKFSEALFGFLMVDRIKRFSKDFGSLEFLLEDDGLVEEFIYSDPIEDKRLFIKADKGENHELETDNQRNYKVLATPNFWRAFFKFEKIWNKGEYKESLEIKWKEEEKKLETIDKQNEQNLNQDVASTSSSKDIKGKSKISIEIEENNRNKMDEIKEDFLKKYVNPEMKVNDWGNFKTEINELLKGFLELILIKDWKTKNDYEHYIENHLKYIHKGVKEIMNKSLKNVGEFIFGRNFTEADASLFAVLIQIFDTAKSLHIDNIFLFRAYKETFMFYVKHVKTKLGLDVEEDKKDKQRHLSLNYEPVNTEDSEYNGPFLLNLPTNFNSFMKYNFEDFQNIFEQTNINIILNELKKYRFTWDKEENLLLFAKIGMKIKENSNLNLDEENIDYFKGMFLEAIFYICSECRGGFEIDGPQIPIELIKKTRKLVYDTIIEFNEEKIAGRVSDEIKEAYEQTFPQKREEEIED